MPAPLFGFADLHCHPMAHLGFGGAVLSGAPDGPVEEALGRCDRATTTANHGAFGMALGPRWNLVRAFVEGGFGHGCCGWPAFDAWPRFDTVVHQQMFAGWVRRAWEGGLRLMCAVAVNNELLAEQFGAPGAGDREAIEAQVAGMRAFVAAHGDWMGLATTPSEARALISQGRLAVVLGVEVDSLDRVLGDTGPLDEAGVEALVGWLEEVGVRVVTPIHLADNAFGGAAVYSDRFNLLNHFLRGGFFAVEPAADLGFRLSHVHGPDRLAIAYYELAYRSRYPNTAYDRTPGGHRNVRGLTPTGRTFVQRLMRAGLLLDVDHMSERTANAVLTLAEEADYPVLSTHSSFRELALGEGRTDRIEKRAHEAMKTRQQVERILRGGGVVAPLTNQGDLDALPGGSVANSCARSSRTWAQAWLYAVQVHQGLGGRGGVALGTDFNGLAQQPGPRFGPDAACGLAGDKLRSFLRPLQRSAQQGTRLPYGGSMYRTAAPFRPHREGQRLFDFNEVGLAHYGLLPDFIRDLLRVGMTERELDPLFSSAEAFVQTWEKCERRRALLGVAA